MGFIDIIRWVFLFMEVSVIVMFLHTMYKFRDCVSLECYGVFFVIGLLLAIYSPICMMHFIIMLIRLLAYGKPFTTIDAIHITYIVIVALLVIRNRIVSYKNMRREVQQQDDP